MGKYERSSIIVTITINEAIAAEVISIMSKSEPSKRIITLKAHIIEQKAIFFAKEIGLCFLVVLLVFISLATPDQIAAETFTTTVSAHKSSAYIAG